MANWENSSDSASDWEECRPGALRRFATQQLTIVRRRHWARVGGVVSAACLLVMTGFWALRDSGSQTVDVVPTEVTQRISCREVLTTVDEFLAHQLPVEHTERIQRHLRNCEHCRQEYAKRAGELGTELIVVAPPRSAPENLDGLVASILPGGRKFD